MTLCTAVAYETKEHPAKKDKKPTKELMAVHSKAQVQNEIPEEEQEGNASQRSGKRSASKEILEASSSKKSKTAENGSESEDVADWMPAKMRRFSGISWDADNSLVMMKVIYEVCFLYFVG